VIFAAVSIFKFSDGVIIAFAVSICNSKIVNSGVNANALAKTLRTKNREGGSCFSIKDINRTKSNISI